MSAYDPKRTVKIGCDQIAWISGKLHTCLVFRCAEDFRFPKLYVPPLLEAEAARQGKERI